MTIALIFLVLAPLVGGLLYGLDRKLTARLQGRKGPPVVQPFYDLFKLLSKQRFLFNPLQDLCLYLYLFWILLAGAFLVGGGNLLLFIFFLTFASVALIMMGFVPRSPYSFLGSMRELWQVFCAELLLLAMALGFYLVNGTFEVGPILAGANHVPLLASLPLIFIGLLIAFTIKIRKSPFDFSASSHAHQELVRGIMTELSGPQLALVELAHWYELVILLFLTGLFWAHPWWAGVLLALAVYFLEIVIDNATSRMTWKWMLRWAFAISGILALVNLFLLEVFHGLA